jgi:hypothetical protein
LKNAIRVAVGAVVTIVVLGVIVVAMMVRLRELVEEMMHPMGGGVY